jgi:hypothetical protein
MKQIYGFTTHREMEVDATLRELRERVLELELQLAELRRTTTDPT